MNENEKYSKMTDKELAIAYLQAMVLLTSDLKDIKQACYERAVQNKQPVAEGPEDA